MTPRAPQAVQRNAVRGRIGTRVALTSTSVGKAWLATLTPAEREPLLAQAPRARFTEHTMTDLGAIRDEIELTAQRGYAEDREENEQSIWCYGAAILGADGHAVGCVSVSMPMFRRQDDAQRSYIEPLLAACRTIAARLGPVCVR
ncbi:IclR family transcriptional regulator [Paraburkholderia sp. EG287B]|uniref:IclR family transcriptional regulator n=1 Tax=Paraburkholderia sp. EG287B TaxID=3237010 RepID=UPI0034D38EEC